MEEDTIFRRPWMNEGQRYGVYRKIRQNPLKVLSSQNKTAAYSQRQVINLIKPSNTRFRIHPPNIFSHESK